jgi:ABC-type Mn2+/Zn2+ transport system permease subunit/ABC-type Mn2+/Zn2+ transport system ATPase subunit
MDAFVTPFLSNPFMVNALLGGVVVSIACGIVGTFVILRGLAFIGDALAHGVLPGIAAALLLGYPGILGAAAGSLAMIAGIGYITRRSNLSNDTAIGLFFVAMLALGVIIVSRSESFSGDLVRILFGELLGITGKEILVQGGATFVLGATALVLYRPFLLLCFSPEQAQVSGFPARLFHGIMLVMIAVTVIVSFQTVGTMLVFGMLLAPAATSALFTRRIATMIAAACTIGAASVYAGLLVSYHLNFAAGASITLVATLVFFSSFMAVRVARGKHTASRPRAGGPRVTRPPKAVTGGGPQPVQKPSTTRADNGKSPPVITAAGLTVGHGKHAVVSGIDFRLERGATLALVGVNGSGKSTLLNTLAGLIPPLSGSASVFGGKPGIFPRRVAYVSQFHSMEMILPLRSIDIVRMARFPALGLLSRPTRRDERLVRDAMETMGVLELSDEPMNVLSGGQRQRIFLAQALAHEADLLLLDEPDANLDAEGKAAYREFLRGSAGRGCAAVVATHDIQEAALCNWAMLLAQRVVAYGPGCSILTPETLLSTFGVVARVEHGNVVVVEREHGHECGE